MVNWPISELLLIGICTSRHNQIDINLTVFSRKLMFLSWVFHNGLGWIRGHIVKQFPPYLQFYFWSYMSSTLKRVSKKISWTSQTVLKMWFLMSTQVKPRINKFCLMPLILQNFLTWKTLGITPWSDGKNVISILIPSFKRNYASFTASLVDKNYHVKRFSYFALYSPWKYNEIIEQNLAIFWP